MALLFTWIVPYLNQFFTDLLFSNYNLNIGGAIYETDVFRVIIVAPVVEEIFKMLGYGIIFLGVYRFFKKEYKNKDVFIERHLIYMFIFSTFLFGLFEGFGNNANTVRFGLVAFYSYVFLNILAHTTYSLYPFILGRKFGNCFICFLPIGILIHSFHNVIIRIFWDNKWITFIGVTFLLYPCIFLKRKQIVSILGNLLKKLNIKKLEILIYSFLIITYFIMLLAVLFYGSKLLF